MVVIGLTGGIASGKSFIANEFAERGAVVLDADRHAHAALAEPDVISAVRSRWGESVIDSSGKLSRSMIAQRVFGDSESATAERRFLEGLVHPIVRQRLQAELSAAKSAGAPAVVLDIPLLIEAGWAGQCDVVAFIETPEAVRSARAAQRGWSVSDLQKREANQVSLAEKRSQADLILSGEDKETARDGVIRAWERLVGSAG